MLSLLFIPEQETSGHRTFEVKRQLVSDVSRNDTNSCVKTLKWAAEQPEAAVACGCARFCMQSRPLECSISCEALRDVLSEDKSPLLHQAAAMGNSDIVSLDL